MNISQIYLVNRSELPHFAFLCWIHVGAFGTIEIIGKLVHIVKCADNTELVRRMECGYHFVFIVFGSGDGTPCLRISNPKQLLLVVFKTG